MILGIGIDAVEIARFEAWRHKSVAQLSRIYTQEEVYYCLEIPAKSAERFAARFAAREALLKALGSLQIRPTLLQVSRTSAVISGCPPTMRVDWKKLGIQQNDLIVHLSLSHTKTDAYAVVILE